MAGFFSASTFRQVGNAATTQNLLTIENIDATKLVWIRRITVQMDTTAALTAVSPLIKTSRTTGVPKAAIRPSPVNLMTLPSCAAITAPAAS